MSSERIENMNIKEVNSIDEYNKNEINKNEINKNEINKNETDPICYYWFDSYLEFNKYNTNPLILMDLEKRYGVKLSYTPSYDAFIKEIKKKKNEEKVISSNVSIKCLECEKRYKSKSEINSHMKTECKLINGCTKYKDYPNWIKKIINTNSELYEDLKLKSKNSGIKFNNHSTIDEFCINYYEYERMMDCIDGKLNHRTLL